MYKRSVPVNNALAHGRLRKNRLRWTRQAAYRRRERKPPPMMVSAMSRFFLPRARQAARLAAGACFACIVMLGMPAAQAGAEQALLAPSGHLRVGVYAGSPTSMVTDPKTGQIHGLSYDLGGELAKRLNVPVEYVTFQRIADVVEAIKNGQVDFTITNATPARANDVSFSPTLIAIELGFLVPPDSSIERAEDIDQAGVSVGVTKGGTSERVLGARFKNAKIISAESVKAAVEMLKHGDLDVYATNKAILFEMTDAIPGGHVLDGNWGFEHMAVAIPKGRDAGMDTIKTFVRDVQASGLVEQIEHQAGLRGAVIQAEPK
jgi:polar amino acid transport system substrate-binding protein